MHQSARSGDTIHFSQICTDTHVMINSEKLDFAMCPIRRPLQLPCAAASSAPPQMRRQALWHYGQVSVNTVYYIIFVCIMHINIATVSHPSPAVILRQIQSFISTLLTSDECFCPSAPIFGNGLRRKLPFGFDGRMYERRSVHLLPLQI